MQKQPWISFALLIGLIFLLLSACAPAAEPLEPASQAEPAPSATPQANITPLPSATIAIEPSATLPATATQTAAATEVAVATETLPPSPLPPTPTPTLPPPPALERTLSLQSPALRGDDVLALQEQLLRLGYAEVGTPDGIFGGMTDTAVRRFQGDQGLVVDGIVGPQTWQVLFSQAGTVVEAPPEEAAFSYYRGSRDEQVEVLAGRLSELGYPVCEIDDTFGYQLEFAVRQFQQANALQADGVVGPRTWELLFSENALPASAPELSFSLSSPIDVGSPEDLAYDGTYIWLADNDFDFDNDWIRKIDPNTGMGIGEFASPMMDQIIGWDGKTYDRYLHPGQIFAQAGILWLGGRSSAATETGTPTFVAVQTSGSLLGQPFFMSPDLIEIGKTVDFFAADNKVWGVANAINVTLYPFSASTYRPERQIPVYDMWEASSAAYDGQRLWLVATFGEEAGIWAVNPQNGITSRILGVCGEELVFDGQWLWVASDGLLQAVDPATMQVVGKATFAGSPIAMTSNGRNQIWLLSNHRGDYYLQSLVVR